MPTKRLPATPSLEHLKRQAKDLLAAHAVGDPAAFQRLREFHPRFEDLDDAAIGAAGLTLSDAQLALAREYGFASWPRLRRRVTAGAAEAPGSALEEQIDDPQFRRALELLDRGDVEGLRELLSVRPELATLRLSFEGVNYFRTPTLLQFIAENPIRRGRLPANIVELTRVILDVAPQPDTDPTLELVASGRVAREMGVQEALIDVLCDYGADPDTALQVAAAHGEFGAVAELIRRGARPTLESAAATGRTDDVRNRLPTAGPAQRHASLALAAQFGHVEIVRLLLDAGEDPDRYNPIGVHSHSTPLHQAALAGHSEVVALLVQRGADLGVKDLIYQATPMEWAEYGGHEAIARYLRSQRAGS